MTYRLTSCSMSVRGCFFSSRVLISPSMFVCSPLQNDTGFCGQWISWYNSCLSYSPRVSCSYS